MFLFLYSLKISENHNWYRNRIRDTKIEDLHDVTSLFGNIEFDKNDRWGETLIAKLLSVVKLPKYDKFSL